jgi:hypothetical protein
MRYTVLSRFEGAASGVLQIPGLLAQFRAYSVMDSVFEEPKTAASGRRAVAMFEANTDRHQGTWGLIPRSHRLQVRLWRGGSQ